MSAESWRKQFSVFLETLPDDARKDRRLAIAAFLSLKKHQILRSSYYAHSPRSRAAGKRFFAKIRSKILADEFGRGRKRTVTRSPALLLYRVKDDFLRDRLCPRFINRWVPIERRLRKSSSAEITLSNFSFARNPAGTLEQIRQIARVAANSLGVRINFTDHQCDDVAPYIVLANVMKALPPVFSGGMINREVATVLESVGLDRMLGVNRLVRESSRFPILPFRMVFRAPPGFFGDQDHLLRPQYKEFIADRFCTAMDRWLDARGFELTDDGAESLTVSITEALDNAERHGNPDVDEGLGDWSMGGFGRIVFDETGITKIECSVSIVSVGATISESLATASPAVTNLVDGYANLQAKNHKLDRNLGRSVVALQDGITRVDTASNAKRGGIGLLTLAELFADLGESDQPDMQSVFTIISGDSCLRLTRPFQRGIAPPDSPLRKLWFNARNDGNMPPDANHVFRINDDFPGTILSACFSIDPTYLQRKFAA